MSGHTGSRALRADPDEVLRLKLHVGDADRDGDRVLAGLETQLTDYHSTHRGADIDTIFASGEALVDAMRSSMAGLADAEAALETAHTDLTGLEAESEALWSEMGALGPDDDPVVREPLLARFDDIRGREDAVFDALTAAFDALPTGRDATLDLAAVSDVIGRDAATITDADLRFEVEVALNLADDYAEDGEFDTPPPISWDDDAPLLDLPDPGPTGDWDGWWLWRDFEPDFDAVSMAGLDATPGIGVGDDPTAVMPHNARQGAVGDCYFVSAVASVANSPAGRAHLRDMMTTNGDGTYTITFGDGVEVTVDSDFYVRDDGELAYGTSASDEYNWFSVLEKGFAARTDNSYEEIRGGWATPSWAMILGEGEATVIKTPTADELTDSITEDLAADQPAALALDLNDLNDEAWDDSSLHEFSVLAIDEATGEVTLRNPWGSHGSTKDGLVNDYGATVGEHGEIIVPIENLAPIVHTYESYEKEQP